MRSCPRVVHRHIVAWVTSGWNCSAIGRVAVAEGLHRKAVALRQQLGAERQVEAFAMPLVDLLRPGIAHRAPGIGRPDRVVADLGMAIRMLVDAAAEMMRQHLGAEADAEKRLLLPERHGEPIDLAADEIVGVVGAHRTAEDDGAGVPLHGLGQRIAEARAADVERIAALARANSRPARASSSPGAARSGSAGAWAGSRR